MLGTKSRSKKSDTQLSVAIDHPVENEPVFPGHYAIRLSVSGNVPVEVSINDGPWEACRPSNGFFWFDWWPSKSGKQKIAARAAGTDAKKAVVRKCTVAAPHSN